jgi:hypothetical protein
MGDGREEDGRAGGDRDELGWKDEYLRTRLQILEAKPLRPLPNPLSDTDL